jgi:glycosyltransferase involved in cell wall biosynthesis
LSVSVAIATFNRASMVKQSIEAALAQTRRPEEIIVSDDASSDGTWAMLEDLSRVNPNVRVFRHERNSGGVSNWNFAMHHARGAYIAWCSDDDRFLPDHLETSITYLERHPSVGFVHSGFVDAVEVAGKSTIEPRPLRFTEDFCLDHRNLLAYMTRYYDWPFHPSTIVMRRAVWEQVGEFDPRFALADTDWFVRAIEQFPAVLLPRHGVMNRRHPGNWSNRVGSARMQREIFEIVEGAIARLTRGLSIALWRSAWRANVRVRLLLTLRMRMKSGHADAAAALWEMLIEHTGRKGPEWLRRMGERQIRRSCLTRHAEFASDRQSVSPL